MRNFHQIEARAEILDRERSLLLAKPNKSDADRDLLMRLTGQIEALATEATLAAAAEQEELEACVARGHALGGTGIGSGEAKAFYDYVRTREPQNLTTGDTGAYVVPEPILAPVQAAARALSPITAFSYQLDLTGGSPEAELPLKSHGVAAHASETGTRSEQTTATFASASVVARDIYSDQRPSSTWLDSVPGAPEMLTRWLLEDLFETLEEDVAIGVGGDRADGLFAATSFFTVVPSGASNALANTLPMSMITAIDPRFLPAAAFVCNAATLGVLSAMSMPSSVDAPLVNWESGEPKMYGFPVLRQTSAPNIGDGAYPLALADLRSAYIVATHRRPGVLVDPYTVSSTGKVRYLASMRVGGCPWNPGACILGKSDTA